MQSISIREVLDHYGDQLGLSLLGGSSGLDNQLVASDVHRPGLALSGFVGLFTYDRAQVLGNSEMLYLANLSHERRATVLDVIYQFDIPCMVVTDGNDVPPIMLELADQRSVPLLATQFSTTKFAHLFSHYLDDVFSPRTSLHGSRASPWCRAPSGCCSRAAAASARVRSPWIWWSEDTDSWQMTL